MVFSSSIFLFAFLPVTLLLYSLSPNALKNTFLLFASLFFYAWGEVSYVLLMLTSISVNYCIGRFIYNSKERHRKLALLFGITFNLALLVIFKYANFSLDNLNLVLGLFNIQSLEFIDLMLPLGISFFSFQAVAYLFDVYRKEVPVEKNLLNLALYIAFFPQLIAGPIVRYGHISKALRNRTHNLTQTAMGVERFIFGLGKKVLIANPLGFTADKIFVFSADELSFANASLGIICYSLQIYFDFSGYSDMAIGLGRIFGFSFPENFRYPYAARSIQDFWRRWHITLSSWFRDYLYIPLGGNRLNPTRTYLNLVIVFFLCGLWHGASWNFIIWGLLHGFFLILERSKLLNIHKLWRPFQHLYVLMVIIFTWIFFRAESLPDVLTYLTALVLPSQLESVRYPLASFLDLPLILVLISGLLLALPIYPWLRQKARRLSPSVQYALSIQKLLLLSLILLGSCMEVAASTYNPFIYFRF